MFVAQIIFISIGVLTIIMGLLVWKKRCYKLMAGYEEGSIKNESAFGKVNGIFVMVMGMWTIVFSFFMDELTVGVFIGVVIVIVSAQIVINVRMAKHES
ncbi:hypothetical protein CN378_03040 [Bacillus sp. AFS015802]|uniref:DUF3784 domain-containing protein n=1 Tax=Bacillus sp. AFS015802 TaxID=2033486 RepID=UPI000BF97193|nr:DUF3784 domain-containing protein [Bacillus sp. AFS015802]PFA69758.1 hypothetical protein CN378_03040 [Bacillus sp. AFS015802]